MWCWCCFMLFEGVLYLIEYCVEIGLMSIDFGVWLCVGEVV